MSKNDSKKKITDPTRQRMRYKVRDKPKVPTQQGVANVVSLMKYRREQIGGMLADSNRRFSLMTRLCLLVTHAEAVAVSWRPGDWDDESKEQ